MGAARKAFVKPMSHFVQNASASKIKPKSKILNQLRDSYPRPEFTHFVYSPLYLELMIKITKQSDFFLTYILITGNNYKKSDKMKK